MLIYSHSITNRLQYILQFIVVEQLGLNLNLTSDKLAFQNAKEAKINYSNEVFENCLNIEPVSILFEDNITSQEITTVLYKSVNCPFPIQNSVLPFDLFAACFYLISRYEEYLPFEPNQHGQFSAKDSFAYKNNFLQLPVVDIWINELKSILWQRFPILVFKEKQFKAQMTYDIDTAYAFKGRDIGLSIAGFAKDLWKGKLDAVKGRLSTLFGSKKDANDTYDYIITSNKGLCKPIFFFLVGDRNKYNKNIKYNNIAFIRLIHQLRESVDIGLHPSYNTPRDIKLIELEKDRLEQVLGETVSNSRQHFLRFFLPTTYNKLLEAGITDEYSMLYAEQAGFRASTCSSFFFYDLVQDAKTTLLIHPITFMEGSFAEDLKMKPNEALTEMKKLISEVEKVNGSFLCIWHNHTLSDVGFWKGWKEVHSMVIEEMKE